jgi:hypothetical protein
MFDEMTFLSSSLERRLMPQWSFDFSLTIVSGILVVKMMEAEEDYK